MQWRRKRRRKRVLADGAGLPLLVGGAALAAFGIGRRLYRNTQLFCPLSDPERSWDPTDYGIPADAVDEHWIDTPDGERLHAWYCRTKKPVASAVFCHGNTGNLTTVADVIPHLLAAGLNILLFDYRGFGRSSGRASFRGVIADGLTAARFHARIRPPALHSLLYGFSLGGAVAAQVARRYPIDALILQSTFTSLPQITRVLFPRLPLHLLAGNLFDTLGVIRELDIPLLVIHGTNDEVIPCWMAHEIYEACNSPKRLHCVDRGLHKDIFVRDPEAIVHAVARFVAELPDSDRTPVEAEPQRFEQWSDSALRAIRKTVRRGNPAGVTESRSVPDLP